MKPSLPKSGSLASQRPVVCSRVGGRTQQGAVIVVVLVLVVLASLLLSQFIARALTDMLVESRARAQDRLRIEARSALEASLARLAEFQVADGGLRSAAQGWGDPLEGVELFATRGVDVRVQVEDESGRISLPRLGRDGLVALGRQLGLEPADATRLAEALLAWTKRDQAGPRFETDPRNYEYEDPPHRAPARPLASFHELAAVAVARDLFFTPEGEPTALFEDFQRVVSLYHFPAVNLNSASAAALQLAGVDEAGIARITAYTAGVTSRPPGAPPYFRTLAEAQVLLGAAVPPGGFDTLTRCLRLRVAVRDGATTFHLTAVVVPTNGTAMADEPGVAAAAGPGELHYPFRLLAWAERLELASAAIP